MKRKYLIIISLVVFLIFLILYLFNYVNNIDNFVYNFIMDIKNDKVTYFMKFITFFGGVKFIIFLMILFIILNFIKGKIYLIFNYLIVGQSILNRIVKIIVRRERPSLINLVEEKSFSFPSGHTMVAVTLYGFLIYLIYKSKLKKIYKMVLILLLVLLIGLIVISRIYLGVHYFSDCIAGIFLALAYLLLCINILERKKII